MPSTSSVRRTACSRHESFSQTFSRRFGQFSEVSYGLLLCFCIASCTRVDKLCWGPLSNTPSGSCPSVIFALAVAAVALLETIISVSLHVGFLYRKTELEVCRRALLNWRLFQMEVVFSFLSVLGWVWLLFEAILANNGASGWGEGGSCPWSEIIASFGGLATLQLCRISVSESTATTKAFILESHTCPCEDCKMFLLSHMKRLCDPSLLLVLHSKGLLQEIHSRDAIDTNEKVCGDYLLPDGGNNAADEKDIEAAGSSAESAGIYLYLKARRMCEDQLPGKDSAGVLEGPAENCDQLANRVVRAAGDGYVIEREFARQLIAEMRQSRCDVIFDVLLNIICYHPVLAMIAIIAVVGAAASVALQPLAIGYLAGKVCALSNSSSLVDYIALVAPFATIYMVTAVFTALATRSTTSMASFVEQHVLESVRDPSPRHATLLQYLLVDLLPWGLFNPTVQIFASTALLMSVSLQLAAISWVCVAITYRIHRDSGFSKCRHVCDNGSSKADTMSGENWRTAVCTFRPIRGTPAGKAAAGSFQGIAILISVVLIWGNGPPAGLHEQHAIGAQAVTVCLALKTAFQAAETLSLTVQRFAAVQQHSNILL